MDMDMDMEYMDMDMDMDMGMAAHGASFGTWGSAGRGDSFGEHICAQDFIWGDSHRARHSAV